MSSLGQDLEGSNPSRVGPLHCGHCCGIALADEEVLPLHGRAEGEIQ